MATTINVTLIEDDATGRVFQLTSGDAPLNITSLTVFAVIKASPSVEDSAATGVYTLTAGDGLTVVDETTGKVRLDYPAAVTASPGWWFYKIRVTLGAITETAIWGWLSISDA